MIILVDIIAENQTFQETIIVKSMLEKLSSSYIPSEVCVLGIFLNSAPA